MTDDDMNEDFEDTEGVEDDVPIEPDEPELPSVESEKEVTEYLFVPLTEDEFKLNAKKQARASREITALEDRKKSIVEKFKSEIAQAQQDLNESARLISEGGEHRPVLCIERTVWDKELVELYRKDTGELLRTRPITPAERQTTMKV